MSIYLMTDRSASRKVIRLREGLFLCDVVPDIQEHLNRSFDRIYRTTISDDHGAESLSCSLLQTAHSSFVEGLDLICHASGDELEGHFECL
jgi:hypothetical protein